MAEEAGAAMDPLAERLAYYGSGVKH